MAPTFLSRMRNGSQPFNKEQSSASTVSLPQQPNTITQRPATSAGAPVEVPTDTTLWPPGQTIGQHEMHREMNAQAMNKNQGVSLRKRFFSKSVTPPPAMPMMAPALRGMEGMSLAEKMALLKFPDGKIDLVMVLKAIEERFSDQFEAANLEPVMQLGRSFDKQRAQYQWDDTMQFPPHCRSVPRDVSKDFLEIFDLARLIDMQVAMQPEIPRGISFYLFGEPMARTMAQLEDRMKIMTARKKNIGSVPSIADRPDWYTDAVFAQQSFTGPNPTSITRASAEWIHRFKDAANKQGNKPMYTMLNAMPAESIYIQDYSYFRNACGAAPNSVLKSEDGTRYGCAAVTLFHLSRDGRLHPLAIVLDYKISMDNSVCIFNRRLRSEDSSEHEASDWAWRYAKMCNQVSDWTLHECGVHLNDCHFVEEATIVATNRAFPNDHVVYNILAPHWLKTLSLNAAARSETGLVPAFINALNGFSSAQNYAFIRDAYKRFNWTARYIPNDLKRRGFPPSTLNSKPLHNYVWAKNMSLMWPVLYKFVSNMLATVYTSDEDVMNDKAVQNWCAEMHSPTGGQMSSFPDIHTLDDLTNAVVMCIHIASPQHNSVNYLQCYYMSFVPNKPASLMAPLPTTLSQLMQYGEREMMAALPIKESRVWLMSSQLPWLLSYGVAEDQTMVAYAQSLEAEARMKKGPKWQQVEKAASEFYSDLMGLGVDFDNNSEQMDDRIVPYHFLAPTELAVSILI